MPDDDLLRHRADRRPSQTGRSRRPRVDDMVRRILREDVPARTVRPPVRPAPPDAGRQHRPPMSRSRSKVAEDGSVLLKNTGGVLPLDTATSALHRGHRRRRGRRHHDRGRRQRRRRRRPDRHAVRGHQGTSGHRRHGDLRPGRLIADRRSCPLVDSSYLTPTPARARVCTGSTTPTRRWPAPGRHPGRPAVDFNWGGAVAGRRRSRHELVRQVDRHPHPADHRHLHLLAHQRRRQPAVHQRQAGHRQLGRPGRRTPRPARSP